jgi:hypothetical protein
VKNNCSLSVEIMRTVREYTLPVWWCSFLNLWRKLYYSEFLLSLSRAPQLSMDVPHNTGFLCDKPSVHFATFKKGPV